MTNNIEDILIVADMDNTLLTAEKGIPACNIAAIKLFCLMGGNFTLASGRSVESISKYIGELGINIPVIAYGGAMVYDFQRKRHIECKTLNKSEAINAIENVLKHFPSLGTEVMAENGKIYVINPSNYTYLHTVHEHISYVCSDLSEISGEWIKVLFAGDAQTMCKVKELCNTFLHKKICFIATNSIYFEIMPRNVSKATALDTLCAITQKKLENCITIGDYYNDIPMLKYAGYSVAVKNSPQEVKASANEVTGDCLDGGVGQFIYNLIKKCERSL